MIPKTPDLNYTNHHHHLNESYFLVYDVLFDFWFPLIIIIVINDLFYY